MKQKIEKSDFNCPICKATLFIQWGNSMFIGNKDYGVTLFCCNGDPSGHAHPQEVSGHGNGRSDEAMKSNAYKVLLSRFTGARHETEGDELVEEQPSSVVDISSAPAPKKRGRPAKKEKKIEGLPVVEAEEDLI